jgi:hypothetical protein
VSNYLPHIARRDLLFSALLSPFAASLPISLLQAAPAGSARATYTVVQPGTHPGIIFSAAEIPALRRRSKGNGLGAEAYARLRRDAYADTTSALSLKQLVGREGTCLAAKLEAMALVYQVEGDQDIAAQAISLFKVIACGTNPTEFFKTVHDDFFATEHWPKAFAFAWDWLYPAMSPADREALLKGIESWAAVLNEHTESWWWKEATYNCGAIPVGALGLLVTAIQGESKHPNLQHWFSECLRKVTKNYFPLTWRDNGLCNEGPGYAHYHKNPTQFLDAVRRTGGKDYIGQTGAVNAMHYLRHHWMPQGRCATIGDNTEYGRRVFQAIYLLGIREMRDAAGLWTFEKYADRERTEAFLQFLYYPDDLKPVSPGTLGLPTSHYFEFDQHRAGYLISRSEWDNERASWFAVSTRYENANHAHYDMNSFVFTAFGEEFGAHTNIYPYSHTHHGADLEHNIVIIDEGGMPIADRPTSAGDDGSIYGYLTGVGTGEFGDYMRGDAHRSYADRSVKTDKPARRADRVLGYVKEGSNPYIVVADNIQKDDADHDYHWQWYTMAQTIRGKGTVSDPFRLNGEHSHCKLIFLSPETPNFQFQVVENQAKSRSDKWGLLRVTQRGQQAEFVMLAIAWETGKPEPSVSVGPSVDGTPDAHSFLVSVHTPDGGTANDLVLWQPGSKGKLLRCASVESNALLTVIRGFDEDRPQGYLLGDGSVLRIRGRQFVEAPSACSVIASAKAVTVTSARRPYEPLPPLEATGRFWLPGKQAAMWRDNERLPAKFRKGDWLTLSKRG